MFSGLGRIGSLSILVENYKGEQILNFLCISIEKCFKSFQFCKVVPTIFFLEIISNDFHV